MNRRTFSVKPRTHSRVIALNEGFDDSVDKIINRLVSFYLKYKDKVKDLESKP